ncbi:hypothetical protein EYF80_057196 [Liparis tanakae]|uniref:Uncharacterized protein n=1 Tax=Liparis tanakae TaxID=230148 RepID=A0A4Z2EWL8_9TELE|nr:hypothetical protein EYF80_057196 [Liparis tanakae]
MTFLHHAGHAQWTVWFLRGEEEAEQEVEQEVEQEGGAGGRSRREEINRARGASRILAVGSFTMSLRVWRSHTSM